MSELSSEEQERLDNWKALQLALGISPEEAAAGNSSVAPAKPSVPTPIPARLERPKPSPVAEDVHLFGEGLALDQPTVESQSEAEAVQEVEVGEAPEEIPDEPASPDDKKRRRRRRRRRRGGSEVNGGEFEPGDAIGPGATNSGPAAPGDIENADDDADDVMTDDDEEEVEPISFADWTVPSWNELIGSLYRPER